MKILKVWTLVLVCTLAMGLLVGCASNADNMTAPTTQPVRATQSPAATNVPTMEPTTMAPAASAMSITTVDDAKRVADQIEDELEKLSEVDEAYVVVFGDAALVGVEYDQEYQGGTTQRMDGMVKDRIKTVHQGLTKVYVTDGAMQVAAIKALEELVDAGGVAFEELSRQAQEIVDGLNGGAATTSPADGSAA